MSNVFYPDKQDSKLYFELREIFSAAQNSSPENRRKYAPKLLAFMCEIDLSVKNHVLHFDTKKQDRMFFFL